MKNIIPPNFVAIDDDHVVNFLTEHTIKNDYPEAEVNTFLTPEQGLEFIRNNSGNYEKNCIVFLDINMPVTSGWEVLDIIHSYGEIVHKKLKIFMLSSSVNSDDKNKADDHSLVSGYIEKPLQKQSLAKIMTDMN